VGGEATFPDHFRLPPPVAGLIGFEVVYAREGSSRVELEVEERHANPMGTVHGGILCDVADAAMGTAYSSQLASGESFATLELKVNFVRPFWTGRLVAEGRMVSGGRTVGMVEADVRDEHGRLIARASSTCMTLRGDAAKGR
jgi:uncharacterized protein (TIGR00369 family)